MSDYQPAPAGSNVLKNPSFEEPLESDPIQGWSCQGETNDPRGGLISRYIKDTHSGIFSGICSKRLAQWSGPGQYIGELFHN